MLIHIDQQKSVSEARDLDVYCLICKKEHNVDVFEFKIVESLLGMFRIKTTYETAFKCPSCETSHSISLRMVELENMHPKEVKKFLRVRIGNVPKFLVIVGWLLIWAVPVSLASFLIALFQLPKNAKGWRRATWTGTIITTTLLVSFLSLLVYVEILSK